jgi:hypothetical protein
MSEQGIPFTKYTLPNGQKSQIYLPGSPEVKQKADAIMAEGYVFEIEILRTGEVSATIMDPIQEMDADIIIADNDQHLPRKVCAMIMRFQPKPKRERES